MLPEPDLPISKISIVYGLQTNSVHKLQINIYIYIYMISDFEIRHDYYDFYIYTTLPEWY